MPKPSRNIGKDVIHAFFLNLAVNLNISFAKEFESTSYPSMNRMLADESGG